MTFPYRPTLLLTLLLVLAGCATGPERPPAGPDHSSRYTISQDRAPSGSVDVSRLEDAVPRYEPYRTAGNKSPYTVWGKQYTVMASADGYLQRGTASWYGEKFHGHKTSNGEIFDMYTMTAAHKNLPIPSYARVTNLENGRSVVVRVNDRGPFHGDRLIDLSYAAAKKLGYHNKGTATVEVAAITVTPDGRMTVAGEPVGPVGPAGDAPAAGGTNHSVFVQVGSFTAAAAAHTLSAQTRTLVSSKVRVKTVDTDAGRFHRVQVGPFANTVEAARAQQQLEKGGVAGSILLTDTH
ncbi:hypothetical protein BG841_09885 [Marinobacter sp. X15-166B]|nr:hypothetical protein BG841_09885 [Marinobacter sp. X15-166B]